MGRPETDIAEAERSRLQPAERELEALRAELAVQVSAGHEAQVRLEQLEQEIAQRDRIIAEGELTAAKLSESETALRQLFDQSLDSMTILDLETGRYIDINEEYARNSGYSREEVVGKRSREFFPFVNAEEGRRYVEEIRRAGLVRNLEAAFRRKDGSTYYGLLSAIRLKLRGDLCIVTITCDISELKETQDKLAAEHEATLEARVRLEQEVVERDRIIAEAELTAARLRESETALRKLFDQNLDSMSILDLETGRYIDINEEYTRNTGYSRDEIIGKRSREVLLLSPEENERLIAELRRAGLVRNMEATFRHRDGSTSSCLISALNLKLREHLCCVFFTRDISVLKETQRQLAAEHEAALDASRAKSEFLSTMSHEIRTPMNAVLGMTELLANSTLTGEQRRWVNVMRSNGDALLNLINDILDLARIESGRLTIERVALDLEEFIDKLGDTMGMRAHEKGLELAMHIAPDVPRNLVGDPLRLRQILVNLLGNAIKFTDRGLIVLSVERANIVAADQTDPDQIGLRFSIRDTGIGIPEDKLSVIFSSFGQADSSTTRRYGGSGLGLAIASRLVKLLSGGEIAVQSELGVGSWFSFVAMFGAGRAVPKRAGAAVVNLRDVETLIVDDTEVNRLILRELLQAEGARVTEAPSGKDALAELEKASATGRPFELFLLDCRMPEMDGIELAKCIREFYAKSGAPSPVVMMLTSDELSVRLPQLSELGVRAYLVKPIRRAELLEAIGRAMGDAEEVAESAVRPPAAEETGVLRGLRILLADDSPDNRMLVRAFLSNTGCQLDEAEDGREAFARFTTGNYDLVLMDIRMPVIDGIEATRAIRRWENENREGQRTPIIALTASALPLAVRTCLAAGCDTHVSKPIKRVTLIDAIRAAADADTCACAKLHLV